MQQTMFKVVRQEKVSERAMERVRARYMDPKNVWGTPYGFTDLDNYVGGIQTVEAAGTNELAVLAARSNVGKSSFAVTIAINVGLHYKKYYPGLQVRIITLEMSPEAMYQRTLGQLADVNFWKMKTGHMERFELERLEKADRMLKQLPITYIEGSYDVDDIGEFIAREDTKTGQKCGYWMLDHIGIVPSDSAKRSGNQTFALGEISRQLHHIAREYAPGLVLAQLNRDSLKRKDPTPVVSDIYGADKIYHDADIMLLLHRPEMHEGEKQTGDSPDEIAYCIVAKNRDGNVGRKIPMSFSPRVALWGDLVQQEIEG